MAGGFWQACLTMKTRIILGTCLAAIVGVIAAPSRLTRDELTSVDFAVECTVTSDPADRMLFEHEAMVNSFLNVPDKFGFGRMIQMERYDHPHFAMHGGTNQQPRAWSEGGHRYTMAHWGMAGDVDEEKAKVYHLTATQLVLKPDARSRQERKQIAEREADPFEVHAISLLKRGEKLVRWERADLMRALGAVRADAVCLRCHEVKQGDLLGAFTYEFTKGLPLELDPEQRDVVRAFEQGMTLKQIVGSLNPNRPADEDARLRRFPELVVRNHLLDAGIVPGELLVEQERIRGNLLRWVESSLGKMNGRAAR